MPRRDKQLIKKLLLKLEDIHQPGSCWSIVPEDGDDFLPSYSRDQILDHLNQIDVAGYLLPVSSSPIGGISFRGFSPYGLDTLDEIHDETEAKQHFEAVPQSVVAEIKEAVVEILKEIDGLKAGNAEKAELSADIEQITAEVNRPSPRRSFIRLFVESTRDNLAKAGGSAIGGALMLLGGAAAKWLNII